MWNNISWHLDTCFYSLTYILIYSILVLLTTAILRKNSNNATHTKSEAEKWDFWVVCCVVLNKNTTSIYTLIKITKIKYICGVLHCASTSSIIKTLKQV